MGRRDLAIFAGAILLAVSLSMGILHQQVLPTGAWGLSFPQEGGTPMGPASGAQLQQYDAVYLGNPEEPVLYLTFDAGYENGYTASILDTLKSHGVSAAFFLAGHYLQQNPDLVRRMAEEGHTVANHTMHHYDMRKLETKEEFAPELTGLEDLYRSITGQALPRYYRPPQGVYSERNLTLAKELGYKTVFWSLAHADWDNANQPDPEASLEKLLSRTHKGAVVLLHSTSQTNAQILDRLITQWKTLGYRFGTLDALFSS